MLDLGTSKHFGQKISIHKYTVESCSNGPVSIDIPPLTDAYSQSFHLQLWTSDSIIGFVCRSVSPLFRGDRVDKLKKRACCVEVGVGVGLLL